MAVSSNLSKFSISLLMKVFLMCYITVINSTPVPKNAVFLSDYTDVKAAKAAARVNDPTIYDGESYAGYFSVGEDKSRHLFFWYFPSPTNTDAPVMVWLNGGPGVSSLQGLFNENGPIEPDFEKMKETGKVSLKKRPHSWVGPFSMVYIDQPVNVGFSYSDDPNDTPTTREEYGSDLYDLITHFYALFYEKRTTDLYIGGQSYAAKYASAFAHTIHEKNPGAEGKIPLKGFYIGGPLYYPEKQAYGFVDFVKDKNWVSDAYVKSQKEYIKERFDIYRDPESKETNDFVTILKTLIAGKNLEVYSLFPSGFDNYDTKVTVNNTFLSDAVFSKKLAKAVHANEDIIYSDFTSVYQTKFAESGDFLRSSADYFGTLMDHYKVMIYNGEYDLITNTGSVEAAVRNTKWKGQAEYKKPTKRWEYGTFSKLKNLCRVIVDEAGHQVPWDKPKAALKMMESWVNKGCVY